MPGSPSPEGRKPGICCQTGQLVTRKGPEGSNPSPGAHLREISACFKTDGWERKTKVVKAPTRRRLRRMNAAVSFNDTAVVTAAEEEKQARTEGEDYEALDRIIDSITRDFSRKGINSRLKALTRKGSSNASTICDHIFAEQTEHNIKTSTADSKVKSLIWLSKNLNHKPFEEMTKQDILSYLNSVRKPTSIDPQQRWIGSYNNRLRYYAKFFRWLYNKEEPDYQKRCSKSSR
jgi:hypothetical protein